MARVIPAMNTVVLPAELEQFVADAVAAGEFRDTADAVAAGIRLLQLMEHAPAAERLGCARSRTPPGTSASTRSWGGWSQTWPMPVTGSGRFAAFPFSWSTVPTRRHRR